MHNFNNSWGLNPCLSIHLHWDSFISKDGDLYWPALKESRQVSARNNIFTELTFSWSSNNHGSCSSTHQRWKAVALCYFCWSVRHQMRTKQKMQFMVTLATSPAHFLLPNNTHTWAILWCCSLITRETAICMLPNTATTSKILSSNDGAPNIWKGKEDISVLPCIFDGHQQSISSQDDVCYISSRILKCLNTSTSVILQITL